jgi:hypothetical protein
MSEKDIWTRSSAQLTPHIRDAGRYTNYLLGSNFPGINESLMNHMSLYAWLLSHRHIPAAELHKRIRNDNGQPLFTVEDLQSILTTLQSQAGSNFARWIIAGGSMSGGAEPEANPLDADPSRSKFWDKYIRKIAGPIAQRLPPSWNGLLWYTFILYSLEQSELLGPTISTLLDSITLSLPVIADVVQEVTEKLIALAPIPYAGFAGEALGMVFSTIFVLFAVGLNVSRKHFGSAFKAALEGIPLFGDILAEGAQSFEIGAERFLNNRKRMLKSVDTISPHAKDFLEYYVPDVEVKTGPAPPPLDLERVKKDVASYVSHAVGADALLDTISDPTAALTGAVSSKVAEAQKSALGAVPVLPTNPATVAAGALFKKTLKGGRSSGKHRRHKTNTTRRR